MQFLIKIRGTPETLWQHTSVPRHTGCETLTQLKAKYKIRSMAMLFHIPHKNFLSRSYVFM
jgi:hypothetical protein